MLLHLAERLDIPLRERNVLLNAAGFARVFPERTLEDPSLRAARRAVDLILAGHEPYPALAVDRHWTLVASNNAVARLLADVAPRLLEPPINVLRLSLHPDGLAPRIVNFVEWRSHLLARLRRQIELTADPVLSALIDELSSYPIHIDAGVPAQHHEYSEVGVPFQLALDGHTLTMFSTTMVFGTPIDITLSELAIESFFPADAATADLLHAITK